MGVAGKKMGKHVYVHRRYAKSVLDVEILSAAEERLRLAVPEFEFSCVMFDEDSRKVRFDSSPGFDKDREPAVGSYASVGHDGQISFGRSACIWHHKWLWVGDDYTGFDLQESYDWSKLWISVFREPASGSLPIFSRQLVKYQIPAES
jgi:hypothetical protein